MSETRKASPLIVSGFSSQPFAKAIAENMGARTVDVRYKQHDDREIEPALLGNVRGHDVVLIASAAGDPNKQILETQFLRDTIHRAGAKNITLVLPYMWYGRSDGDWGERKTPALASVIENLRGKVNNVVIADPHNPVLTRELFQVSGANCTIVPFAYPFAVQLRDMFNKKVIEKDHTLFLHPDAGSVKRIGPAFRDCLYTTLGIDGNPNKDNWPQIGKDRDKETNESETKDINVDVKGMDVVVFEDLIASAKTACDLAKALKDAGARSVFLFGTTALLTYKKTKMGIPPIQRIEESSIDAAFITNTHDHSLTSPKVHKAIQASRKIHELDVAPYTAAVIKAIHMEVFDDTPDDANSISAIIRGKHPDQETMARPAELKMAGI